MQMVVVDKEEEEEEEEGGGGEGERTGKYAFLSILSGFTLLIG